MKVWTIESGEYSDYGVDGIFSTKENAETMLAKLKDSEYNWYKYRIKEHLLDPGVEALREGYARFQVLMLVDGTVESISLMPWGLLTECEIWRRSQAPGNRGRNVSDCLSAIVFARDAPHAIKIVNDQRAELIARGAWD